MLRHSFAMSLLQAGVDKHRHRFWLGHADSSWWAFATSSQAQATKLTLGRRKRGLIVVPALVLALSLAFTGAASAQSGFQATVKGANPKPTPCGNGDFFLWQREH